MGNKPSASPFPSYDTAVSMYSAAEVMELKAKFDTLRFACLHFVFDFLTYLYICVDFSLIYAATDKERYLLPLSARYNILKMV